MNLTFPIASSSDAISMLENGTCHCTDRSVVIGRYSLGWSVGWRIATLSFYTYHRVSVVSCTQPSLADVHGITPPPLIRIPIATYLQHMQERCLSGIIQTEEQEFGVLVKEA